MMTTSMPPKHLTFCLSVECLLPVSSQDVSRREAEKLRLERPAWGVWKKLNGKGKILLPHFNSDVAEIFGQLQKRFWIVILRKKT